KAISSIFLAPSRASSSSDEATPSSSRISSTTLSIGGVSFSPAATGPSRVQHTRKVTPPFSCLRPQLPGIPLHRLHRSLGRLHVLLWALNPRCLLSGPAGVRGCVRADARGDRSSRRRPHGLYVVRAR